MDKLTITFGAEVSSPYDCIRNTPAVMGAWLAQRGHAPSSLEVYWESDRRAFVGNPGSRMIIDYPAPNPLYGGR
jgi:hypothetical protein